MHRQWDQGEEQATSRGAVPFIQKETCVFNAAALPFVLQLAFMTAVVTLIMNVQVGVWVGEKAGRQSGREGGREGGWEGGRIR